MNIPTELYDDPLAKASLTPEERRAWESTRTELHAARERLRDLEKRLKAFDYSLHDEEAVQTVLTRPEFNREVARMLAFDERYGGLSSVLYFDIENLDEINRLCGQEAAASIVSAVGDTLTKFNRRSDIVGRLGPDEFGVLLARCDNDAAWKKGESLAELLMHKTNKLPHCLLKPVISYGAYTFRDKENVATGLKQAAQTVTRATQDAP